jgi:hypothetical protein
MGLEYVQQIHMDQADSYEHSNECLEYDREWDVSQLSVDPNRSKGFCSMEFFSLASLLC